jgi:hypothetical protein
MNVFRAALTFDFWITGLAIARYVPRAFRVKHVDGDLFFTEEKRQEYRRRVESVTPNSQRQWGTWKSTRCFTISTWRAAARRASITSPTRAT